MEEGGERIEVLHVNVDDDDVPESLKYLYSITSKELN